ncbi:hypothetical protein KVF89_22450 [Nocardioides carbamazepini]|uniref:DUF6221 family protein n=1 Tax=Nocardioides carbamazepini TaxID=2854259 RepID=UPI002149B733|nr:DUF6221 family protein [Nocardioides carbamazepini]MCR1785318.1 hypothetical protein [Nocardioides carbamazepini]
MSTMDELVAFCLARISEDEEAARSHRAWDRTTREWVSVDDIPEWPTIAGRVLAECETKRGLIEWAQGIEDLCALGDPAAPPQPHGEQVIRILAETWADHDDYNPTWANDGLPPSP